MKNLQILLIAGLAFLVTSCYTQLETVQHEPNRVSHQRPAPDRGHQATAYEQHYTDDEWAIYEEGYYDGVFDTEIAFRDFRRASTRLHVGVGWGAPFWGFGYSYGYFYDPYWRWAQLYDPYYFWWYGYYAHPVHFRHRHHAFFYSPFGWGRPIIVYNNVHVINNNNNFAYRSGPRSSGVHRANHTEARNRTALASDGTRSRGGGTGLLDDRTRVRQAGSGTVRGRGDNTARSTTVDRSRGQSTPQTSGTVDRSRGTAGSSGNVTRTRGGSQNTGSGNVNRTRGSSGSGGSATPARNRGGGSTEGSSRTRGGGDELSALSTPSASTTQTTRERNTGVANNNQDTRTQQRQSEARPAQPQQRQSEARPAQPQQRQSEARPAQSQQRQSEARPAQPQQRQSEARPAQPQQRQTQARQSQQRSSSESGTRQNNRNRDRN